ncbi:PLDc_N domain-containing protein [Nocardioides sp. GY 10127]|nr:PLDc_N domain-containing protein [Nocardioides sp. GY 10127]
MSFLDVLWAMLVGFALVAYLMIMFSVIVDLFRDDSTSGWLKAVWVVCLILFPLLTSLVYLIARGNGMAARSAATSKKVEEQTEEYIRSVAGSGPAAEIAHAHRLLEQGAISESEYEALKARAIAV